MRDKRARGLVGGQTPTSAGCGGSSAAGPRAVGAPDQGKSRTLTACCGRKALALQQLRCESTSQRNASPARDLKRNGSFNEAVLTRRSLEPQQGSSQTGSRGLCRIIFVKTAGW